MNQSPTVTEVNSLDHTVTQRPMTPDELSQCDADRRETQDIAMALHKAEQLKASAQRKIAEASGLTNEEIAALGF